MGYFRLEKLSNSLDSSTNVLTPANQNTLPMNIQQLLHYVGNAEVSNVPVINMKTLSHEMEHKTYVPHVIFLPGIEGVASTMEPLARKLKARISCMQYSVQVESITELAKSLLPVSKVEVKLSALVSISLAVYRMLC